MSQARARGITRCDPGTARKEVPRTPAKHFACGLIVPECDFVASAPTEEEVLTQVAAHAADAHGVKDITPELAAQVKAAIETR